MVPDRIGRRRRQELSLLRDRSTRSRRVVLLQQTHDVGRHVDLQGVAGGLGRGRRRLDEKRNRQRRRNHGGENRLHHRSEEHTSELQSLMRISYAVFCLKKQKSYSITYTLTFHLQHLYH